MSHIKLSEITRPNTSVKFCLRSSRELRSDLWWRRTDICDILVITFLARDALVKTNRRAIAMMFVRLSGTDVHCDHTVYVSANLS